MSSANLQNEFSGVIGARSPVLMTYETGPISDPSIMPAVMSTRQVVKKFVREKVYSENDRRNSLQASYRRGRADRAEISCVGESSVAQCQMPSKNPIETTMTYGLADGRLVTVLSKVQRRRMD